MSTIAELKRKIKTLQKKQAELREQEYTLMDEVSFLQNERYQARIKKNIHVGDIKVINEGITQYHCDPIRVFEILEVSSHKSRYKHNGEWVLGKEYHTIKAREYSIHCYDFDMSGNVEVHNDMQADTLLKAKKMSKADFEEFKTTLFLNPDIYENSKWDPKKKESNNESH